MSERYAFIAVERADPTSPYPVVKMCRWLSVSCSGFYEWASAPPSARALRRATVGEHVKAAFAVGRGAYGVRRVHAVLGRSDEPDVASASLFLVRALMAENGLRACQPRAYRVTTVAGPAAEPAVPDHVQREFTADAPGSRLVGDITYSAQPVVMCCSAG